MYREPFSSATAFCTDSDCPNKTDFNAKRINKRKYFLIGPVKGLDSQKNLLYDKPIETELFSEAEFSELKINQNTVLRIISGEVKYANRIYI
jgi:hypothetical protein